MNAGVVRLLKPTDVEVFRRMRLEALREEPAAFASTAADWEVLPDREWRRRLAERSVFVSFQDNEPVGVLALMRQRPSNSAHRGTVTMLYVRESLRGVGVSNELFDALIRHARDGGIRQLEAEVSAQNPAAQHFCRRQGFTRIGRIPGGLLYDGKYVDEIVMARRVSS